MLSTFRVLLHVLSLTLCTGWAPAQDAVPIFLHPGDVPRIGEEIGLTHSLAGVDSVRAVPQTPAEQVSSVQACEDDNEKCKQWAADLTCEAFPTFMLTACRKTCNMCTALAVEVRKEQTRSLDLCADFISQKGGCAALKTSGACETAWLPMSLACRNTCRTGACHDYGTKTNSAASRTPQCEDASPRCVIWKLLGQCSANPKYMLRACQRSCGTCGFSEERLAEKIATEAARCDDFLPYCVSWMELGHCKASDRFVVSTCRKTCNAFSCKRRPHIYLKRKFTVQAMRNRNSPITSPQQDTSDLLLQISAGSTGVPGVSSKRQFPINETHVWVSVDGRQVIHDDARKTKQMEEKLNKTSTTTQKEREAAAYAVSPEGEKVESHPGAVLARLVMQRGQSHDREIDPHLLRIDDKKPKEPAVTKVPLPTEGPGISKAVAALVRQKEALPPSKYHKEVMQKQSELQKRIDALNDKLGKKRQQKPRSASTNEDEDEVVICVDEDEDCPHWASTGQCKANPMFMFQSCKYSCQKCRTEVADLTKETGTLLSACSDYSSKCRMWAEQGHCRKYWLYMSLTCKAACRVGPCRHQKIVPTVAETGAELMLPKIDCKDEDPKCFVWSHEGKCATSPEAMLKRCPRSCGSCGWSPAQRKERMASLTKQCGDFHVLCSRWKEEGKCGEGHTTGDEFAKLTCRRSCGMCGAGAGGSA